MSANETQVGGSHYQSSTQHWDVVIKLYGPGYLIGNATKYVTRWRKKNGVQDLKKALHYVDKLIEYFRCSPKDNIHAQLCCLGLPGLSDASLIEFASANNLSQMEERVCGLLFSNFKMSDLLEARTIIMSLIEQVPQPVEISSGMSNPRGFDPAVDTK